MHQKAMLKNITDEKTHGKFVCIGLWSVLYVCVCVVFVCMWAGWTEGLQGKITAQICLLLLTHTLLLRPLKAYP